MFSIFFHKLWKTRKRNVDAYISKNATWRSLCHWHRPQLLQWPSPQFVAVWRQSCLIKQMSYMMYLHICSQFDSLTFQKKVKVMCYNIAKYVVVGLLWPTRMWNNGRFISDRFRAMHQLGIQTNGQADESYRRQSNTLHLPNKSQVCWCKIITCETALRSFTCVNGFNAI